MAKIYISSTFADLREHRDKVISSLRKAGHIIVAMEDYVATAKYPPLKKCLDDVEKCDYYVGIFAWRYGYIPSANNPTNKSITELEYRKACESGKPTFVFLLDVSAGWSPKAMDVYTGEGESGKRIQSFRDELGRDKLASFFKTPDDLVGLVMAAVNKWETDITERIKENYIESDIIDRINFDIQSIESLNKSLTLVQVMKNNGAFAGERELRFREIKKESQDFICLNDRIKDLDKKARELVSEIRGEIDKEGQEIAQEISQKGRDGIDFKRLESHERVDQAFSKFERETSRGRKTAKWLKERTKELVDDGISSALSNFKDDPALSRLLNDEIQQNNLQVEIEQYLERIAFALSLAVTDILDDANGLNGFPRKVYRQILEHIKKRKIRISSSLLNSEKDLIISYIDHLIEHVFYDFY